MLSNEDRLRKKLEEAEAMLALAEVFTLRDDDQPVKVIRCMQRDGSSKWKVGRGWLADENLNRDGRWEFEGWPSNRDEEFFSHCRYDTREEAFAAARKEVGS